MKKTKLEQIMVEEKQQREQQRYERLKLYAEKRKEILTNEPKGI